ASLSSVFSCMQAHGWRGFVTYQPAGRYWPFQGIETGIYVLLAAALIAVTFVVVRRRDAELRPGGSSGKGSADRAAWVRAGLARVAVDHEAGLVDRLEVLGRDVLEQRHQVIGPLREGGAAEVPVAAVVGQDQAVVLHFDQDGLGVGAVRLRRSTEAGHVEARLEAEAGAHRRPAGDAAGARLVPGRPDIGGRGGLGGEPDRVRDRRAGADRLLDLRVVQQPGQDRQPGRVGRGP